MNNYEICFRLENGFEGMEVVSAVNKFMAWEMFETISKGYESRVVAADCRLTIEV